MNSIASGYVEQKGDRTTRRKFLKATTLLEEFNTFLYVNPSRINGAKKKKKP